MRERVDDARLRTFMRELARESGAEGRVYLTGGATAVLFGWRTSTLDVDVSLLPEDDRVLRAIARLKDSLNVNVELAAPSHFIPELPGWEERSRFIAREGQLSFYHYDFYSQALAKIERGHRKDQEDVRQMLSAGLVERERLRDLFGRIESQLYRYPAIDAASFRAAVEAT